MESIFAERIQNVPKSFIREILKVSLDPEVISFAGGLPNPRFFPVAELEAAATEVFRTQGANALQYSSSDGLLRLRQQIAERYKKTRGIDVDADKILITCGSQQGLDLLGKIILNKGDGVLIEEPGYLGAIQALSVFRPTFYPVPLTDNGIDTEVLAKEAQENDAKLLYTVPRFQNPSGLSYTKEVLAEVANVAKENDFLIIEDDPYGDLRFRGEAAPSFYSFAPKHTVLLGTFSKTVAPGFRVGWIVAPQAVYNKLLVAKQATDLHTSSFSQLILSTYLENNNLDEHLVKIATHYGENCLEMEDAFGDEFGDEIRFTKPEGGMFLWGELPEGMESMALFEFCAKEKVVFVPGEPFYTENTPTRTFRLSFSCVDSAAIKEGLARFKRGYAAYKASLV